MEVDWDDRDALSALIEAELADLENDKIDLDKYDDYFMDELLTIRKQLHNALESDQEVSDRYVNSNISHNDSEHNMSAKENIANHNQTSHNSISLKSTGDSLNKENDWAELLASSATVESHFLSRTSNTVKKSDVEETKEIAEPTMQIGQVAQNVNNDLLKDFVSSVSESSLGGRTDNKIHASSDIASKVMLDINMSDPFATNDLRNERDVIEELLSDMVSSIEVIIISNYNDSSIAKNISRLENTTCEPEPLMIMPKLITDENEHEIVSMVKVDNLVETFMDYISVKFESRESIEISDDHLRTSSDSITSFSDLLNDTESSRRLEELKNKKLERIERIENEIRKLKESSSAVKIQSNIRRFNDVKSYQKKRDEHRAKVADDICYRRENALFATEDAISKIENANYVRMTLETGLMSSEERCGNVIRVIISKEKKMEERERAHMMHEYQQTVSYNEQLLEQSSRVQTIELPAPIQTEEVSEIHLPTTTGHGNDIHSHTPINPTNADEYPSQIIGSSSNTTSTTNMSTSSVNGSSHNNNASNRRRPQWGGQVVPQNNPNPIHNDDLSTQLEKQKSEEFSVTDDRELIEGIEDNHNSVNGENEEVNHDFVVIDDYDFDDGEGSEFALPDFSRLFAEKISQHQQAIQLEDESERMKYFERHSNNIEYVDNVKAHNFAALVNSECMLWNEDDPISNDTSTFVFEFAVTKPSQESSDCSHSFLKAFFHWKQQMTMTEHHLTSSSDDSKIQDSLLEALCRPLISYKTSKQDCFEMKYSVENLSNIDFVLKNNENDYSLRRLELSVNSLTSKSLYGIGRLRNLEFLDLKDNKIVEIPHEFSELQALRSLQLDSNQITSLSPLTALANLTCLTASRNRLSQIPNSFSSCRLSRLEINHNMLTKLETELPASLVYLDVSDNKIVSLDGAKLSASCPKLGTLVLSRNVLSQIPTKLMFPLLRQLWLSGNHLTNDVCDLDSSTNYFLPMLESLYLQDNQLSEFPRNLIRNSPNLKSLDLSFNKLRSELDLIHLRYCLNIQSIDIKENVFNTPNANNRSTVNSNINSVSLDNVFDLKTMLTIFCPSLHSISSINIKSEANIMSSTETKKLSNEQVQFLNNHFPLSIDLVNGVTNDWNTIVRNEKLLKDLQMTHFYRDDPDRGRIEMLLHLFYNSVIAQNNFRNYEKLMKAANANIMTGSNNFDSVLTEVISNVIEINQIDFGVNNMPFELKINMTQILDESFDNFYYQSFLREQLSALMDANFFQIKQSGDSVVYLQEKCFEKDVFFSKVLSFVQSKNPKRTLEMQQQTDDEELQSDDHQPHRNMATRIQAGVRGYLARKRYKSAVKSYQFVDSELDDILLSGEVMENLDMGDLLSLPELNEGWLRPASSSFAYRQDIIHDSKAKSTASNTLHRSQSDGLQHEINDEDDTAGPDSDMQGGYFVYGDHRRPRKHSLKDNNTGNTSVSRGGDAGDTSRPWSQQTRDTMSPLTQRSAVSECSSRVSNHREEVDDWHISDANVVQNLQRRNKRMKQFAAAKEQREREKDPMVRLNKIMKTVNGNSNVNGILVSKPVAKTSGSFGGRQRTFRQANSKRPVPAWMLGEATEDL